MHRFQLHFIENENMSGFEKPYPPNPITYTHYNALVDAQETRFGSAAQGFIKTGHRSSTPGTEHASSSKETYTNTQSESNHR